MWAWGLGLGVWCLKPLSTIFLFYPGGLFLLVEETWVPGENHRPVASHWQTLSHNVVSNTPHLSGIQTCELDSRWDTQIFSYWDT